MKTKFLWLLPVLTLTACDVLCVLPSFGATNPQIARLIKEKQQKYAQLEQCTKKVNGFKIAGISTLGLTAVGIGGNVALASKNKQLDKEINGSDGLKAKIKKEQEKLGKLNEKIEDQKDINDVFTEFIRGILDSEDAFLKKTPDFSEPIMLWDFPFADYAKTTNIQARLTQKCKGDLNYVDYTFEDALAEIRKNMNQANADYDDIKESIEVLNEIKEEGLDIPNFFNRWRFIACVPKEE